MAENNFSLQKTLTMLLDEKKYHSLRDILSTMNPADIAAIFDDLDQACLPLLFRLLPKELAAETFVEMEPEAQELLIRGFSDSELKEVIDELYVDDAVDIVEEMPANVVQRILSQAEPDMRKQINEILRYPEDSAGSIMTTEYVSLRPNMTVEEAILRIRRTGIDKETIYTCYVTRGHKLIGLTSVKDLLLCEDDDATIESIMQEHVITVSTLDDKEQSPRCSASTTSSPCRSSTRKTGWSVSSRSMTPWTSWKTRPPRIWKKWPLCSRPSIRTCGRRRSRSGKTASRGCCC